MDTSRAILCWIAVFVLMAIIPLFHAKNIGFKDKKSKTETQTPEKIAEGKSDLMKRAQWMQSLNRG